MLLQRFSKIIGLAAIILCLAEPVLAHRMTQRVFDPSTGTYIRARVRHRHTGSGRVIVLGNAPVAAVARPSVYRAYGAPVTTYRTYTTYNPYVNRGYRYYDSDGYRYYRNNTGAVLGRVLLNALR